MTQETTSAEQQENNECALHGYTKSHVTSDDFKQKNPILSGRVHWKECPLCDQPTCGLHVYNGKETFCRMRECEQCHIIGCPLCVPVIYIGIILGCYPPQYPDAQYRCKSCKEK